MKIIEREPERIHDECYVVRFYGEVRSEGEHGWFQLTMRVVVRADYECL